MVIISLEERYFSFLDLTGNSLGAFGNSKKHFLKRLFEIKKKLIKHSKNHKTYYFLISSLSEKM